MELWNINTNGTNVIGNRAMNIRMDNTKLEVVKRVSNCRQQIEIWWTFGPRVQEDFEEN